MTFRLHAALVSGLFAGMAAGAVRPSPETVERRPSIQTLDIRLREAATRELIPGAILVVLRDTNVVAQALSDDSGRAVLRIPEPGTYRLKVNRIGYRALLADAFAIEAGQTLQREILMTVVRTVLPAVTLRSLSRCDVRGSEGELAVALWEQIRLALTANVLTEQQWAVPLRVHEFRRDLDLEGKVEREWIVRSRVVRGPPFGAFAPETLSKRGYAYVSGVSELTFAAPDAALLLSDEFVNTHCFRAVPGPKETVGLMFEPVLERKLSDVRGTLWVNRATSELQSMEYSYTGLWRELQPYDLGGRLEFTRVPTGAWIVSYWHIRMPRAYSSENRFRLGRGNLPQELRTGLDLAGYADEGGRVEIAKAMTAAIEGGVLRGRVYDSTASRGLSGAMVHVDGQADSVVTDEDGRYEIDVRVAGEHRVTATHERLGLLSDSTSKGLLLSAGDSVVVNFAVPSFATFVRALCGDAKSRAGIIGIAANADGVGTPDLDVRARWELAAAGSHEDRTRSGPGGIYAFCDVPVATPIVLQVMGAGAVPVRQRAARLVEQSYYWLDVRPSSQP